MKKLTLLATMVLCLALAMPALAAIDHPPMTIDSDGETATFTLTVKDLPEMLTVDRKTSKQGDMEYNYTISFFDGEHGYRVGLSEMHFSGNPERTMYLPELWNTLFVIGEGSMSSYVTDCTTTVEGDVITWTLALPVVDEDGNEYPMDLDNITAYSYYIYDIDTNQQERCSFKVLEDGTVEEIEIMDFYNLIG